MAAAAEEDVKKKEEEPAITPNSLADPSDPMTDEDQKLAHSLVCMALGLDESIEWSKAFTTDKKLSIQYTYASEGADTEKTIATVRGKTRVENFEPKDWFDFCEGASQEEYDFYFNTDSMCEEATVIKRYSKDRCLIHSRFNAHVSSYIIAYRDVAYFKRRLFYENCRVTRLPDGRPVSDPKTYAQVSVGLVYSIPAEHPDYFEEDSGHVRGNICFGGYCFFKEKADDIDCDFTYIVKVDPKGLLPTWVVNLAAPGQARVCTFVRNNIDTVRQCLAKRRGLMDPKKEAEAAAAAEEAAEKEAAALAAEAEEKDEASAE